jgi:hypothetical protein
MQTDEEYTIGFVGTMASAGRPVLTSSKRITVLASAGSNPHKK